MYSFIKNGENKTQLIDLVGEEITTNDVKVSGHLIDHQRFAYRRKMYTFMSVIMEYKNVKIFPEPS